MKKLRVMLADDHNILRTGLKLLLNNDPAFTVVGEAKSGEEALALLREIKADILVLDLSMPGSYSGMDIIKLAKKKHPQLKILVLTMHSEKEYIQAAMENGANGYLEKTAFDEELTNALHTIAKGNTYLANHHALLLVNSMMHQNEDDKQSAPPGYDTLSSRERDVMQLIVRGFSLAEIGKKRCLSVKTIDTYKSRIMLKLGIEKKNELVEYALTHGLLVGKFDENA